GSCPSNERRIPAPVDQVQCPRFTTYVRGQHHDIRPLFLPVAAGGMLMAVPHAPRGVAIRPRHTCPDVTAAAPSTSETLPRPNALCWPHPKAPLCRVCADRGVPTASSFSTAAFLDVHARTPTHRRYPPTLLPR